MIRKLFIVAIVMLLPVVVLAADGAVEPGEAFDWQEMFALFLNSFAVVAAVQLLKKAMPTLRQKVGWTLPIIAVIIGPLMVIASNAISVALGYPVDLNPIAGVIVGLGATGLHQIGRQVKKLSD